jgi:PAS domain S-box-containing protein
MKDQRKIKTRLGDETEQLRARVAELEKREDERIRADRAYEENLDLYRTLVETSPDTILMHSLDGVILAANAQAARMYGAADVDAFLAEVKSLFDLLDEEGQASAATHMQNTLAVGSSKNQEYLMRVRDGNTVTVEMNSSVVTNAAGEPRAFISVIRDITERKILESEHRDLLQRLYRSERNYRALVDNTPAGVYQTDLDGKMFFVNQAFADMLDCGSPEEMMNINAVSLYKRKEDREAFIEALKKKGLLTSYDIDLVSRTGGIRHVLLSAVLDGDNIWGTVVDITERKRAEVALKESEELFRFIAENMGDIVWILDLELKTTYVSPSIERVLGYTQEERRQQSVETMMTPESLVRARDLLIQELKRDKEAGADPGRSASVEIEYYHKDGSSVWMENDVKAMRSAQRELIGVYGVSRNITERKQAAQRQKELEERLQRAEKMEALGALAGGVAHDLNNVLGVLVGYAELLLLKTDEANPLRRFVTNIMNSSERAAAIVLDLLTMARRGVHTEKVVNLNDIIADYQKTPEYEKLCSFHPRVRIETRLETGLSNIMGSPVHLTKSVMNLVSNAAEAMPDGGLLVITTENRYLDKPLHGFDELKEGNYVVLSLSDTGEGISPEDMKHIFEPFYTKKVMGRSGTGLGLSVVWGTVKDHNGSINVQSEAGKGSTFTLFFPATSRDISTDQIHRPAAEYMGRGESLLVVDDVEGQRDLASQMLSELNYSVASVSSGEDAVAYLKDHKVDLVILDMIMDPGMDGLDTYREILAIHPRQKAIIVSGYSETTRVRQAQALGAGAYVRKPYVLERIGTAIRNELDKNVRR